MYSSVRYSVKLEDGTTPFFNSSIGVKQGCNLSPTLFNIFINDVPNLFDDSCDPVRLGSTNLYCLLYTDDLVLLSESQKGLQYCLTKLERYTNRWKLNINKKKIKNFINRDTSPETHIRYYKLGFWKQYFRTSKWILLSWHNNQLNPSGTSRRR